MNPQLAQHVAQATHNPAAPPPWAVRAVQRTPFLALVRVEFRKLAGTASDRILLVMATPVLIGVGIWLTLVVGGMRTAAAQIEPGTWSGRFGHVVFHAVLIKLIAGEWQHKSAQPTLLVQPSRRRYFMAQATVVLTVWLLIAALQLATTLIATPISASNAGAEYLLDYRLGWVTGVTLLSSLLPLMAALIIAMLIPNAAGALAVYFAVVPAMLILIANAPTVFVWIDPGTAATALATLSPVDGPAPVLVSLGLWSGLLALAGVVVARRDLA